MEAIARKAHICKMRASYGDLHSTCRDRRWQLECFGGGSRAKRKAYVGSSSFEQFQSVSEWTRDNAARTLAGSLQPGLQLTIIARVDTKLCFRRLAGARRNLSATLLLSRRNIQAS